MIKYGKETIETLKKVLGVGSGTESCCASLSVGALRRVLGIKDIILYEQKVIIIDVRTLNEYYKFGLKKCAFLPLSLVDQSIIPIPKDYSIVVISNQGKRAKQCCLKLNSLGYRAFYLEGGLEALCGEDSLFNLSDITSPSVSNTKCVQIYLGDGFLLGHTFARTVGATWFFKQIKVNTRFIFHRNSKSFIHKKTLYREFRDLVSSRFGFNKNNEPFIHYDRTPHRQFFDVIYPFFHQQNTIFESCCQYTSLNEQHKIISSQLPIEPDIHKQVDEYIRLNLKHDWLGVHLRGTDIYIRTKDGLDSYLDSCIARLKASLDKNSSIFVCSDQAQFVDRMCSEFPGRVFARDIQRSYTHDNLHTSYKYRSFLQQKEAMIDLLILAKAKLVYVSLGRYGLCAKLFNPSLELKSLISPQVEKNILL